VTSASARDVEVSGRLTFNWGRRGESHTVGSSFNRESWPDASFVGRLAEADRDALLAVGMPCRFEDEQALLVQGDSGDFLYILVSGVVKVAVAPMTGAQTTLAIRSRGDIVGEYALLDDQPRTATARAAGPVTALRVNRPDFLGLMDRSPAAQAAVTGYLLAQMRMATERRAAERIWEAKERLAQVLYDLALQYAQPGAGSGTVRIPISQGDLGDLAGVAVSTTERVLKDLRRQGVLSTRYREITIRDMDRLDKMRFPQEKSD
jgi:CRP/FNR family transcriptional regulator, cyclic AMP receptor protein